MCSLEHLIAYRSHLISCTTNEGIVPSSALIGRHNRLRSNIVKVSMHTNTPMGELMKMPISLLTAIIEDLNEIIKERNKR